MSVCIVLNRHADTTAAHGPFESTGTALDFAENNIVAIKDDYEKQYHHFEDQMSYEGGILSVYTRACMESGSAQRIAWFQIVQLEDHS